MDDSRTTFSWADFKDDSIGPVGSPRRDRWERNMARYLRALRIERAVTRHWPTFMKAFWPEVFRGGLRGAIDSMSFCFLGDFLFHGRPVTQEYADSWMSRVHIRHGHRR